MAIYRKGADVEALDAAAARLESLARSCEEVRIQTQSAFAGLRGSWGGADFRAFDQRWPAFDDQLTAVDTKLRAMVEALRANVRAQRAASVGAGGSSAPGSATPAYLRPDAGGSGASGGSAPSAPGGPTSPAAALPPSAVDAFEDVFGHPPATAIDAGTARALDPTTTQARYQGVDSVVTVGRIQPVPGAGLVSGSLFIPRDQVFNLPVPDQGDDRGFNPHFAPDDGRVTYYVDYENGVVIARQNPSVTAIGEPIPGTDPIQFADEPSVRVEAPSVQVQQHADGTVHLTYDAVNPFAPPGAAATGRTVNGDLWVTPSHFGAAPRVDGVIGDYPAHEIYHESPSGRQTTLLQDDVEDRGSFGPLNELPDHHDVGDPNSVYYKLYDRIPVTGDVYEHRPYGSTTLTEGSDPPRVRVVPQHHDPGHPEQDGHPV